MVCIRSWNTEHRPMDMRYSGDITAHILSNRLVNRTDSSSWGRDTVHYGYPIQKIISFVCSMMILCRSRTDAAAPPPDGVGLHPESRNTQPGTVLHRDDTVIGYPDRMGYPLPQDGIRVPESSLVALFLNCFASFSRSGGYTSSIRWL